MNTGDSTSLVAVWPWARWLTSLFPHLQNKRLLALTFDGSWKLALYFKHSWLEFLKPSLLLAMFTSKHTRVSPWCTPRLTSINTCQARRRHPELCGFPASFTCAWKVKENRGISLATPETDSSSFSSPLAICNKIYSHKQGSHTLSDSRSTKSLVSGVIWKTLSLFPAKSCPLLSLFH